jgi:hypothetical protein
MSTERLQEWQPGKKESFVRRVSPEIILVGKGKIRVAHCCFYLKDDPEQWLASLIDTVATLQKDSPSSQLQMPVQILEAILKTKLQYPETDFDEFPPCDYYASIWAETDWSGLPEVFKVRAFRHTGNDAYELINCSETIKDELRSAKPYPQCSVCGRPNCMFHD